jgi:molybdenum cofactor synthesis domain-containing protein
MALVAKILTVSDSVFAGTRDDTAAPQLAARLEVAGFTILARRLSPDGIEPVAQALRELCEGFAGLVLTTGGTGFSPRDLTPEATLRVLDREAPGLGEAMRATSPFGALSRSRCGTAGRCLIINTPGSPRGALESLEAVLGVLPHALELLATGASDHPPDTGGSTTTSS